MYRFSIESTDPGTKTVSVITCGMERRFLWTAAEGEGSTVQLDLGRHVLRVGFPDGDDSPEIDIRLTQVDSI